MGINARNLDMIYTHNPRRNFPKVDDKILCKSLLAQNGIPTPNTYHVVTGPPSLLAWTERMSAHSEFVIKPNSSYGGLGIILVKKTEDDYETSDGPMTATDINFHIMQILNGAFALDNISDTAFFEQKLSNHPGITAFLPPEIHGVADVRIIYRGESAVMAMLRLPTRESHGKANLHQGGIGVGIDLETGLTIDGCYRNSIIAEHPETGMPLRRKPVPLFADMLQYGRGISDIVGLGYIGVDFVVDADNGPMVLEVNARPGLNIQIANQCGLRRRLL